MKEVHGRKLPFKINVANCNQRFLNSKVQRDMRKTYDSQKKNLISKVYHEKPIASGVRGFLA
jgi:hypothetical protein